MSEGPDDKFYINQLKNIINDQLKNYLIKKS